LEKEPASQGTERKLSALQAGIIGFIESRSEAGQLVTAEEVYAEFLRMGFLKEGENPLAEFEALLKETVEQKEDLREIADEKGLSRYYSARSMAEPYARILVRRGEDPLVGVAEVIRDNSRRYPRPVRLDLFEDPLFGLTPEEISACLKKMGEMEEYQDIQQTTTSIGTVFLYSRQSLDPDHAAMLAEWLDVGQSNNP